MDSAIANVSSFAVWGSLLASAFQGVFLICQSFISQAWRKRYIPLACCCVLITINDFLHTTLSPETYEIFRIILWIIYAGSLQYLFSTSTRVVILTAIILSVLSASTWFFFKDLASSTVIPSCYYISAYYHFRQFLTSNGFASALLAGLSFCIGLLCSFYYFFIVTADQILIISGYAHYAALALMAVLLGWIQLPRELEANNAVQVSKNEAFGLWTILLVAELCLICSIFIIPKSAKYIFPAITLLQLAAALYLFFLHRHRLVIHTDNIEGLLKSRTLSLIQAQQQLEQYNIEQKKKLELQEQELTAKSRVIERQRRLELAAQTAGQAAHDIQNLISPILVQIAEVEKNFSNTDLLKKSTKTIKSQVAQLLNLNSQMLSLSRRARKEQSEISITELLDDLMQRFSSKIVKINVQDSCWIKGSWAQISSAIANLVGNAIEATESNLNPEVQVNVSKVKIHNTIKCHLGFLMPGTYCCIKVKDNGSGIKLELIDKIFEPFYSSKRSSNKSGSGLGLTIVGAVVDDHNAVLDLESSSAGTTFTLYFVALELDKNLSYSDLKPAGGHIMLVDDDTSLLTHYRSILEGVGYQVTIFDNGQDFIRALTVSAPDLLILDLNMQQLSGYETLYAAIHLRPGIKTVIHSSYITDQDMLKLNQLGMITYLEKPCSKSKLLYVVNTRDQ